MIGTWWVSSGTGYPSRTVTPKLASRVGAARSNALAAQRWPRGQERKRFSRRSRSRCLHCRKSLQPLRFMQGGLIIAMVDRTSPVLPRSGSPSSGGSPLFTAARPLTQDAVGQPNAPRQSGLSRSSLTASSSSRPAKWPGRSPLSALLCRAAPRRLPPPGLSGGRRCVAVVDRNVWSSRGWHQGSGLDSTSRQTAIVSFEHGNLLLRDRLLPRPTSQLRTRFLRAAPHTSAQATLTLSCCATR